MNSGHRFSWRKEIDTQRDLEYFILKYEGCPESGMDLEAWITPTAGSNLCRFSVDGKNVIDFNPDLLRTDFTGTPVLYPTPNRVRNAVFRYQGENFPQSLRGTPIYEHGLVHGEPWQYREPQIRAQSISLVTWLDFEEGNELYASFPFQHRISLKFTLTQTNLTVSYSIDNKDRRTLPFGFGLHPYFSRLGGDQGTFVELPARYVMDNTSDLLPTGKLTDVTGTQFDLRMPVHIGAIDLDHVFTGITDEKYAQVSYPELGIRVSLVATDDFRHMVLYSPRGVEYFCLENQTCSTDAHNLFDRGFVSESGLKFILPGNTYTGSVTYQIKKES